MKPKEKQKIKISFPLGLYFQQLFCPKTYVKLIDPFSFWRRYRINHLEACWDFNMVRYLERCRQIEWQPTRQQQNNKSVKKCNEIGGTNIGLPWEKTPQNTILISQPSMKLKYRGVTYLTNPIVAVNTNQVKPQPSQITLDSSKKITTSSNNGDISKTSSNISQPK